MTAAEAYIHVLYLQTAMKMSILDDIIFLYM